jgi:hypothetical protein
MLSASAQIPCRASTAWSAAVSALYPLSWVGSVISVRNVNRMVACSSADVAYPV